MSQSTNIGNPYGVPSSSSSSSMPQKRSNGSSSPTSFSTDSTSKRSMSPSQKAAATTLQALSKPSAAQSVSSSIPNNPQNALNPPSNQYLYPATSSKSQLPSPFNVRNNSSLLSQSLYSSVGSPSASKQPSANNPRSSPNTAKSPNANAPPFKREVDIAPTRIFHNGSASTSSISIDAATSPNKTKSSASTSLTKAAAKQPTSPKRKKANRACFHCQKAHLTCDDSRPCKRCIKKGLADTCTDGFRKKAKYLFDEEELQELKSQRETKAAEKQRARQQQQHQHQHQQGLFVQLPTQPQTSSTPPQYQQLQTQSQSQAQPQPTVGLSTAMEHALASVSSASNPATSPSQDFMSSQFESGQSVASHHSDHTFDLTFDPSPNFGSEATSLEYSILSSMLNGTDLAILGPNSGSPDFKTSPAMGVMDNFTDSAPITSADTWNISSASGFSSILNLTDPQVASAGFSGFTGPYSSDSSAMAGFGEAGANLQEIPTGNTGYNPPDAPPPAASKPLLESINPIQGDTQASDANPTGYIDHPTSNKPGASDQEVNKDIASRKIIRQQQDTIWKARIAKVYRDVTKPYPYPEGYHFLIKYVTEKFGKQDVLRIVRALAIFRPSLIALQMPLTEEDEIFVERSFQRTILEFEKLISFSGTPTVVWRRTCEICVVGVEFCMLTQWPREQLMGRYIYEFMDKNSTLDYWEKFALHAFENTTQTVMTTCTLLTPQNKPVPCAWSFTIKRDVFDLPSLIVGNFLPVLS